MAALFQARWAPVTVYNRPQVASGFFPHSPHLLTMKLLAVAALATLAAAELSPCITECAQNVTAANATACASKEL